MKQRFIQLSVAAVFAASAVSTAHAADTYSQTKYPIVLVHGMAGAAKYFGVVDYFYGVPSDLRSHGAKVFVVDLSAMNSSNNARGEQLASQVRTILAQTGAAKVNLVAHSQGGFDSRYVATIMPTKVASVTTINTPHRGSQFADYLKGAPDAVKTLLASGADFIGSVIGFFNGQSSQDSLALLEQLSTSGAASWNSKYPTAGLSGTCGTGASSETRSGSTQYLYSWTGKGKLTTAVDLSDAAFVVTGAVMKNRGAGDNDGVVSTCSANFGRVIASNYLWNHIDANNQLLGLVNPLTTNPKSAIRDHANRLKLAGL